MDHDELYSKMNREHETTSSALQNTQINTVRIKHKSDFDFSVCDEVACG
jgi:hypothetical protein